MPITVITGLPGAGKTLRMMEHLLAEAKQGARRIYVAGIDGITDGPWTILDDPTQWQQCAPGSIVYVDEAWKWFGHLHDARSKPTPPHVLALAEHRHQGLDFVWTTQGPGQLYPFARTLIADHIHLVRRWGTPMCDVYQWGELVDDVKSQAMRDRAVKSVWTHPKKLYGSYKSAEVHTIKASVPWRIYALPAVLLAAIIAGWYAYRMLRPEAMTATIQQGQAADASLLASPLPSDTPGVARGRDSRPMTADEWLQQQQPRVAAAPWSAPIFDGREPVSEPRVYCMSSDVSCRCVTEQATAYQMDDALCRVVARHGMPYNPWKAPADDRGGHGPARPLQSDITGG